MMQGRPSLGIDVGGGSAKIGIVSLDGVVLAQDVVVSDPTLSASDLIDSYLATANVLQKSLGIQALAGIGIGLPGHIDFEAGTTRLGNVPSLNGFPIVDALRNKSGNDVFLENDATLAALAEFRFGVGKGSNRFLTVALGTGIGVGFIEDGKPVHTSNGTLGDIGHVIVDPKGMRTCRQGCHGCLESVASALAIRDSYDALRNERMIKADTSDGLEGLFQSARDGDGDCARIIELAAQNIAAAVVTWMHIFAPDRIAFAGGMSAAGEDLLSPIRREAARLAMPYYLSNITFLQASLGNKAGFVGAASLCFKYPPQ